MRLNLVLLHSLPGLILLDLVGHLLLLLDSLFSLEDVFLGLEVDVSEAGNHNDDSKDN